MIRRALRQFDFAANHVAGIARVLSPEGTFTAVCHEYRWRGERRVQGDPRSGAARRRCSRAAAPGADDFLLRFSVRCSNLPRRPTFFEMQVPCNSQASLKVVNATYIY